MIDVLLVDDHPQMRRLLREMLETYADLTIVAEAENGEDAVTQTTALQPSVVLIDVNLPAMNGIQATKLIKHLSPRSVIIGLTAGPPGETEQTMIAAGAAAVIDKGEILKFLYPSILEAIRQIKSPASPLSTK
jgi:DNA-binding NarL/FixJ family response regulator